MVRRNLVGAGGTAALTAALAAGLTGTAAAAGPLATSASSPHTAAAVTYSRVAAAAVHAPRTGGGLTSASAAAPPPRRISYREWTGSALRTGRLAGVRVDGAGLRLATPTGRYVDRTGGRATTYAYGTWTSPWASPGFGLTELVPSWEADTPKGTWLKVEVRGVTQDGRTSSWDTIARWAAGDRAVRRTSLGEQPDDAARVATDTWVSNYATEFRSWRLRLTLFRRVGTTATPHVDTVGAMTSRLPRVAGVPTSRTTITQRVVLDVPRYSQMVHRGEYPRYGGGGEAWCSPTSTSMVLGYYDRLPSPRSYGWVNPSYADRFVDHAARMTYDYRYQGTGNWPFNTAYAAARTGHAFVTRLRSLREAERFVKAGIPVVASIAFGSGKLTGSPLHASNGHLVVIVGFTADGDPVVNDPAARQASGVRRTYDRGQFEDAWLVKSGGLSYVIRDDAHPLPARHGAANW